MAIEVMSNVHAAFSVFAQRRDLQLPRHLASPRLSDLPQVASLGCSVFDVSGDTGVPGTYLIELDYPLAAEQCACHLTPFTFFAGDDIDSPVPAPSPSFLQFVAHLDDTFKVVFVNGFDQDRCDVVAGPFHCSFLNFAATVQTEPLLTASLPDIP